MFNFLPVGLEIMLRYTVIHPKSTASSTGQPNTLILAKAFPRRGNGRKLTQTDMGQPDSEFYRFITKIYGSMCSHVGFRQLVLDHRKHRGQPKKVVDFFDSWVHVQSYGRRYRITERTAYMFLDQVHIYRFSFDIDILFVSICAEALYNNTNAKLCCRQSSRSILCTKPIMVLE